MRGERKEYHLLPGSLSSMTDVFRVSTNMNPKDIWAATLEVIEWWCCFKQSNRAETLYQEFAVFSRSVSVDEEIELTCGPMIVLMTAIHILNRKMGNIILETYGFKKRCVSTVRFDSAQQVNVEEESKRIYDELKKDAHSFSPMIFERFVMYAKKGHHVAKTEVFGIGARISTSTWNKLDKYRKAMTMVNASDVPFADKLATSKKGKATPDDIRQWYREVTPGKPYMYIHQEHKNEFDLYNIFNNCLPAEMSPFTDWRTKKITKKIGEKIETILKVVRTQVYFPTVRNHFDSKAFETVKSSQDLLAAMKSQNQAAESIFFDMDMQKARYERCYRAAKDTLDFIKENGCMGRVEIAFEGKTALCLHTHVCGIDTTPCTLQACYHLPWLGML